jgi:hypothetical protein
LASPEGYGIEIGRESHQELDITSDPDLIKKVSMKKTICPF